MRGLKIILIIALFLVTVTAARSVELNKVTISGMLSIQYVDVESDAVDNEFFYLGSIDDDPSTEHSYIALDIPINENTSAFYKQNLTGGENILIEELYIDIKNLRKIKEKGQTTVNLKAGIFYVPFGLGVKKEVDYKRDKGVLVYGSYGKKDRVISYEAAIVDGDTSQGSNERDVYLKGAFLYKDIPCSISILRGKEAGDKKIRGEAFSAGYILKGGEKIEAEYIRMKNTRDIDYFYLKGEKKFKERNTTAYITYIETNPDQGDTETTTEYAIEYEYTKNTIIKASYVNNNSEEKGDLYKAELRIEF